MSRAFFTYLSQESWLKKKVNLVVEKKFVLALEVPGVLMFDLGVGVF